MNFKWLYKTFLRYSCDLKDANLKTFCKEWTGTDSLLKHANQELYIYKVIHENKVILKRLGSKEHLRPDVEMTYSPDFKTIHFTIQLKKRSFSHLSILFAIFIALFLFSHSIYGLLLFLNDAKYILLGFSLFYMLILLYGLYEEKELTKKDFEQELYYQRMKYEEL